MKNKAKNELGIFIKSPNLEIIECCGILEIDFIIIDMEHVPLSPRDLYPLVIAAERWRLKLIVRLPKLNEEYFKWCLDLGIPYLQVPQVETVSDVENAIKYSYFKSIGQRGLCRHVRSAKFSNIPKKEYIENAHTKTHLIFQIEGKNGLKNLDNILENKHVKNIMVGPYDLSQALGYPGDIWNDIVTCEINNIIIKCKKKSIRVGVYTDTVDGVKYWFNRNADYVEYGSDLMILSNALKQLKTLKD